MVPSARASTALIRERFTGTRRWHARIDGTLMGARFDNSDSLTVGRPVALLPLVHRSAYAGVGQCDVTAAWSRFRSLT